MSSGTLSNGLQPVALTLTGTSNAYSGGTTISAGTLQIGNGTTSPGSLPGNVVIGTLAYTTSTGSHTATGALTFNTPAAMSITASGNISGSGSGGLTKSGAGFLSLTGNNTYSGVTAVNGGTLSLDSPGAVGGGNITFGGGTMQFTVSNTADYSSQIVNSTGPIKIDTNGQTVTFGSSIASSNTGGLYLTDAAGTGTLILNAEQRLLGQHGREQRHPGGAGQ